MIELPSTLAPWAAQLALLSSDLALTLAPWVGRLALAVGPMSGVRVDRSDEPDGYGGLARRGSYERLVTTEWGVADLFPDEFLRRAAAGEHMFLDLARRGPRGALRSVAIVSAGPAQLGAPRLAHLAALIVLARRAAAAGATFSWGVLEDPARGLTDGLDGAAIRRLLDARTARTADPTAIAAWRGALGGDATDWWWIGAGEDAAAARAAGASCLIVRDPLLPGVAALELEIRRSGAPARLRLELPAPDLCARLLRDPFAHGGGRRLVAAGDPARAIRFGAGGRKLVVQRADGGVDCWPIPNSTREPVGKPRRWTPRRGDRLIALGIGKRAVLAATIGPGDASAITLSYGGHVPRVTVFLPNTVHGALVGRSGSSAAWPVGTCGLVRLQYARTDLVLEAVPGRLVIVPGFHPWPGADETISARPLSTQEGIVLALSLRTHGLQWAELRRDGDVHLVLATAKGNRELASFELPDGDASSVPRFGFSTGDAEWGPVAVPAGPDRWLVMTSQSKPIEMRSVTPVIGVGAWKDKVGLLTQANQHRLAWIFGERRELLPPSSSPIVASAVCGDRPQVGWVTADGEVVVYSMSQEGILLRIQP